MSDERDTTSEQDSFEQAVIKKGTLANVAAERRMRETAEERFERVVSVALWNGNSLRAVAEAAGVAHTTVKRIAEKYRIRAAEQAADDEAAIAEARDEDRWRRVRVPST